MGRRPHYLFDLIVYLVSLGAILMLARWNSAQPSRPARKRIAIGLLIAAIWLSVALILTPNSISGHLPNFWVSWIRAGGVAIAVWSLAALILTAIWMNVPVFSPKRRELLKVARAATFAAPVLVTGFGFVQRDKLTLRQVDVHIPNLPRDLQGLRLVQISDIHLSPFVSESLLARAVDMANETRADIGLVTGDLITRLGDPLDLCL
jgi:hypothetical protein